MKPLTKINLGNTRARPAANATFASVIYSDAQASQHLARRKLFSVLAFFPAAAWWGWLLSLMHALDPASATSEGALREIINKSLPNALLEAAIVTVVSIGAMHYLRKILFRDPYDMRPLSAESFEYVELVADVCPPVQSWVTASKERASDYRNANLTDISNFYQSWSGDAEMSAEERHSLLLKVDPEYAARQKAIQRIMRR